MHSEKNALKKIFEFVKKRLRGSGVFSGGTPDPANLAVSFSHNPLTIYEAKFHPIIFLEKQLFYGRLTVHQ